MYRCMDTLELGMPDEAPLLPRLWAMRVPGAGTVIVHTALPNSENPTLNTYVAVNIQAGNENHKTWKGFLDVV